MDLISDLKWRGLIYDIVDEEGLVARLKEGPVSVYCGFDPTADSLHIGHLVPIITLMRFKQYGNKPVAIIGGGTGLIGDPSGKTVERSMNTKETVALWSKCFEKQIGHFLKFDDKTSFCVNNYDWFADLKAIDMWRDYGKHFNINIMMQKDSVKSRLESGGLTYLEFSYMIMQSIDFLKVYQDPKIKCEIQIGGQDQWGNLTAGLDLIRKVEGPEAKAYALTMPLILKSDGTKYGKTESGAVWLDKEKTTPYEFYQFFINVADADVMQLLKYYTFLSHEEIKALEKSLKEKPELREAQKALAWEVTTMVHGENATKQAIKVSEALFSGDVKELTKEDIIMGFKGVRQEAIEEDNILLIDALVLLGLAQSKREARQFIENGAILVNGDQEKDLEFVVKKKNALDKAFTIIRRGKKRYGIIKH